MRWQVSWALETGDWALGIVDRELVKLGGSGSCPTESLGKPGGLPSESRVFDKPEGLPSEDGMFGKPEACPPNV